MLNDQIRSEKIELSPMAMVETKDESGLRELLLRIQDLLSDNDRQRLHFLLGNDIPKSLRDDSSLGGTLRVLESLFDRAIITDEDCRYLIHALKRISCPGAAKRLIAYQQAYHRNQLVHVNTVDELCQDIAEDKLQTPNIYTNIVPQLNQRIVLDIEDETSPRHRPRRNTILKISLNFREILLIILLMLTLIGLFITVKYWRKSNPYVNGIAPVFNVNLLTNGDAETGPCENNGSITNPTGWNYKGAVTQVTYESVEFASLSPDSPGPSNRGRCYFYGHRSSLTWMWQTIALRDVYSSFIDRKMVKFRVSAWLGGWEEQNDHAQVIVTFLDQDNQRIGHDTTIGPVYASHRNSITSLLFQQTTGSVPVRSRFANITALFTRTDQTSNDASIDNISFDLYL